MSRCSIRPNSNTQKPTAIMQALTMLKKPVKACAPEMKE